MLMLKAMLHTRVWMCTSAFVTLSFILQTYTVSQEEIQIQIKMKVLAPFSSEI